MTITGIGIYHFYNRGNNCQKIFFNEQNYFYFLRKCYRYLKPNSEILAWCLMPNHFHFLIEVTEKSLTPVKTGGIIIPAISNGFRLLQSSFAKEINKQQNRTGNLFQQKTKAKLVSNEENYPVTAFHYIHQNPLEAHLVTNAEDWEYSSFKDFTGERNGNLVNKNRAYELLNLTDIDLRTEILEKIDEVRILKIL